jgi:2-dehydro-3-deoxyphosphogluconate aldolase/(4S)-4-hydroxy-2-oxoglutarate aldolase
MDKSNIIHEIGAIRILPVVRTADVEDARDIVAAVARAGCRLVEITLTIPGAVDLIREMADSEPHALVGAGTVSTVDQAKACIDAGAQFIVSPWIDTRVIEFCNHQGVAVIPGALTPTEIRNARHLGADIVKVFPIDAMGGSSYIRSLSSVMPEIPLIPTGGVTVTNAADFLRAGAFAVGIGSDLVRIDQLRNGGEASAVSRLSELLGCAGSPNTTDRIR